MSVYITKYECTPPNMVDGVSVKFKIANLSGKKINAANVVFSAFDKNDKRVLCNVRWKHNASVICKNIEDGEIDHDCFLENGWYSTEIQRVHLDRIEVEFEDGDYKRIGGDDAQKLPDELVGQIKRLELLKKLKKIMKYIVIAAAIAVFAKLFITFMWIDC